VLEAAASSSLFPCENQLRFGKEYFLQLKCFKVEKVSVCSNKAYSAEMKIPMYLSKENHAWYKLKYLAHCLPVRILLLFERNPSTTWVFQGGDRLFFLQILPF
jgi:hypothetical protein